MGKRRQSQLGIFFVLMVFSVFAEILSIGAVIPFITVITNPAALFAIEWLNPLLVALDDLSNENLLHTLTFTFIFLVIFAGVLRVTVLWVRTRLIRGMGIQLRTILFARILQQPYEYHINHNSSDLISLVTEKSGMAVAAGIMQVLAMSNAILLSIGIIVTLIWLDPLVAIFPTLLLGVSYMTIAQLARKRIKNNGEIVAVHQPKAVKSMQEGIGGIRDVIMDDSHSVFINQYENSIVQLQTANTNNQFLAEMPRPILELIGMVTIALLAFGMIEHGTESTSPLPILAAFALGTQRLLPSLQQIYGAWTVIHGSLPVINEVVQSISCLPKNDVKRLDKARLNFQHEISFNNVSYHYPGHVMPVFENVQLTIKKGQRVGIKGKTGSGKSTLVDLLMGLLTPTDGNLTVDGNLLMGTFVQNMRSGIAHVPQSIFLSDNSIAENIAFGLPKDEIDLVRVQESAKKAHIGEFIRTLPSGFHTQVGERGVRLSGGQRQRIGIARALYRNAEILIFDEATSALDTKTEADVIQAINDLSSDLTIVVIAHRLSTLDNCDQVYTIDNGKLVKDADRA